MEKEFHVNEKSFKNIIIILVISLPVLYGFFLVNKYGVNIPIADEYNFLSIYDDMKENGFSFAQIWEMHNEHRMFFPNLIFLLNIYLSGYNVKWLLNFSIICISIAYYSICWLIYNERNMNDSMFVLLSVMLGFLFFNSCQYENMLWGFQIAWFMIIAFLTVGVIFFTESIIDEKKGKLILACIMAIVASFTSLHGLFVWGAFISILFSAMIKKSPVSKGNILVLVGMFFSFALYFIGATNMSEHPKTDNFIDLLKTLFLMMGTIVIEEVNGLSLLLGILVFAICVICVIQILKQKKMMSRIQIVALGYMSYGYLALGAIAVGRAGYGIEDTAITSRYTTNTIIIYISLVLLLVDWLMKEKRNSAFIIQGIIVGLLFATNYNYIDNFNAIYHGKEDMLEKAYNYTFYEWPSWDLYAMVQRPDILEKYRLSIYRTEEKRIKEFDKKTLLKGMEYAGECKAVFSKRDIQIVKGYIFIDSSQVWLFNIDDECLFNKVYIEIDGRIFECNYGDLRPDVSEKFNNPEIIGCGLGILLDKNRYEIEGNEFTVIAVDNLNKKWYSFEVK